MKNYFLITLNEFIHLNRSKYKIISLIFYSLAVIYGCYNGYELFRIRVKQVS